MAKSNGADPVRPFHIWDADKKKDVRWRYYATAKRAHNAALLLVRWEHVHVAFEVVDVRTQRHLGTYRRELESVSFTRVVNPRE